MRTSISVSVLLLLLLVMFMTSCSIQKRHYRDGFYISLHRDRTNEQRTQDVTDTAETDAHTTKEQQALSHTLLPAPDTIAAPHNASSHEVLVKKVQKIILPAALKKQKDPPAQQTEQPGAEKDRPNRTVLWMMIGAILLVLLFFLTVISFLPAWVYVFAFIAPAAGLLLYLASLLVRKRIVRRNIADPENPKYLLSKWYFKFAMPLHLLFGAIFVTWLGLLFSLAGGFSLDGLLGLLGILIAGVGSSTAVIMTVILLVILLVYLFKWRKNGEQKIHPDEKRRKDE